VHGDALVIAEGFDGPYLPAGFGAEVRVELDGGTLVVPAGANVDLPPVVVGADSVEYRATLAPGSASDARLALIWEGSSAPAVEAALTADAGVLAFTVTSGAAAVTIPSAGGEKSLKVEQPTGPGNALVVRISEPSDARSPLLVDSLLALGLKD
jgi:hypothetical protein